jgi:hypothetical protein
MLVLARGYLLQLVSELNLRDHFSVTQMYTYRYSNKNQKVGADQTITDVRRLG